MSNTSPKVGIELIQKLRTRTGVGMMDCRKALEEAKGDIEEAVCLLRKKGLSVASKRGALPTENGITDGFVGDAFAAIVEVSCETDFSARTQDMKNFAKLVAEVATTKEVAENTNQDVAGKILSQTSSKSGHMVQDTLDELMSKICESIKITTVKCMPKPEKGVTAVYVHPDYSVSAMVELGTEATLNQVETNNLLAVAREICMQIAVTNPNSINPEDLSETIIKRETEVAKELAIKSGKPENFWDKIIEGKIKKFYEEACLNNQKFIKDDSKTVAQYLEAKAKELGLKKITISNFARIGIKR